MPTPGHVSRGRPRGDVSDGGDAVGREVGRSGDGDAGDHDDERAGHLRGLELDEEEDRQGGEADECCQPVDLVELGEEFLQLRQRVIGLDGMPNNFPSCPVTRTMATPCR